MGMNEKRTLAITAGSWVKAVLVLAVAYTLFLVSMDFKGAYFRLGSIGGMLPASTCKAQS